MTPLPIRSERLDLVVLSKEVLDALIAGERERAQGLVRFPIPDEFPGAQVDVLRLRSRQLAEDPRRLPWLLRAIVLRESGEMVGFANFHGPPGVNDIGAPRAAEIGYRVFERFRSRGYATEAARAMMEWATREHGVRHFISGIRPENAPSLRVIEKLAFRPTGEVVDGELIFELRLA